MSVPLPLAVRLVTGVSDRHVTAELRDLAFRTTAPGGFAAATLSLDRPLGIQPDEITYYGKLYIYDTRTGATVWEGRLEDPGRGARPDGQVWQLTAAGPAAHARDRTVPLIYVDHNLSSWQDADRATPGASAGVTDDPSSPGRQVLKFQFPEGLDIVANSRATMRYWPISYAGQKIARINYAWDAGATASCDLASLMRTAGGGTADTARTDAFNVAGGGGSAKVIASDWTAGRDTWDIRAIRTGGATTVGSDTLWAVAVNPTVLATLYDATGTEMLTGASYGADTYLSSQIVADLLGRLLPAYDGTNAAITAGSHAIDQMAYPDGVSPAQVLTDLMQLDAGYYWAAWESNAAGKYRFEWSVWPSVVRYEADATDGFDSPGSADGLYNAVRVRWRDPAGGLVRTNRRTQSVAELTAAGITREAIIDLGDDLASSANADRVGDNFLDDHEHPPNAGTLTVARPIMDLVTGHRVWPWEIRPGNLIRVRGVLPRVDSLNATARDGASVLRIVSNTYDTSRAAATLELDSYSATTARALADLRGRPATRRR